MLEDITDIKKDIREYIEIKMDLIRLQTAESISRILSSMVIVAIMLFLLFLILLFLSFAAGYFFSSLLHSNELGFVCVAGFYGLMLVILLIFKKQIIERPVIKTIIKLFFPNSCDNEK